jgi:hypothetical protein
MIVEPVPGSTIMLTCLKEEAEERSHEADEKVGALAKGAYVHSAGTQTDTQIDTLRINRCEAFHK